MDLNSALGASGAGQKVTAEGKEWTLLPPTKKCLADFQAWCEQQALERVAAAEGKMPPEQFARYEDKTIKMIHEGGFAFGKEANQAQMQTYAGMLRFAATIMRQAHPELTDEMVEKLIASAPKRFKLAFEVLTKRPVPNSEAREEGGP